MAFKLHAPICMYKCNYLSYNKVSVIFNTLPIGSIIIDYSK